MIAVIDYDTGNLCSVANALKRLGVEYHITADPSEIRSADRVLLPGVGEASSAMQKLRERGLVEVIRSLTQPVLGICIGVQLLCKSSEEGNAECLGIFDNRVRKFDTFLWKQVFRGIRIQTQHHLLGVVPLRHQRQPLNRPLPPWRPPNQLPSI